MTAILARRFRLRPFQPLALCFAASALVHGAGGIWLVTLSATSPRNPAAPVAWLDLANQAGRFTGELKTAPRADSEDEPVAANRGAEKMDSFVSADQMAVNDGAVRLEGGSGAAAESHYLGSLLAELKSRLVYPRSAKLRGEQGRVEVTFTLGRGGEVRDPIVSAPSPHPRLNEAALELVRGLEAFHPMPAGHPRDLRVTVPFDYRLR